MTGYSADGDDRLLGRRRRRCGGEGRL